MTIPDTRCVPVLCITLPILIENSLQTGIKNRPYTVIVTVCNQQNIRVKVKQVPSVAASVPVNFGGAMRDRTADLYNAIVALSQLSYSPISWWRRR